jgi:hypothetical protein
VPQRFAGAKTRRDSPCDGPTTRRRAKLFAVGLLLAVSYAAGCVVGRVSVVAIAAMFLVAGAAWTTLVNLLWPLPASGAQPPRRHGRGPPQMRDRSAVGTYAVLFATAAAVGIAVAYVLDLSHPAWAGAAAVYVMCPDPDLLTSRAIGRVCATVAGVLLAAVLYRRGVGEVAVAVIAVWAVTAMVAIRTSRWYVTAAGSGLVVLLISGVSSTFRGCSRLTAARAQRH